MLKARTAELWTAYIGTPLASTDAREKINDQVTACEYRLLALGIIAELDEDDLGTATVAFRDATDQDLIDADGDFRGRLTIGDLEPTAKLALERNLEDLAKTLGARGWDPVVEEEDGETLVGWVRKQGEVDRLKAEYTALGGEEPDDEETGTALGERLLEIEARLHELGVDVVDGDEITFKDRPTDGLVDEYWEQFKLAEDPDGSQAQLETAGERLIELAGLLTARGWEMQHDPTNPDAPKAWGPKPVQGEVAEAAPEPAPKKRRSKKAEAAAA